MKNWSIKYNALPQETRKIAGVINTETRIQQLEMEKDRLKRSYKRNLQEINSHIKSLIGDLKSFVTTQITKAYNAGKKEERNRIIGDIEICESLSDSTQASYIINEIINND